MFEVWGRFTYRWRWPVLVAGLVAVLFMAVWGTGVFGALKSTGGFTVPHSQSDKAKTIAARDLGSSDADVVIVYTDHGRSVDDPSFRSAVTGTLAALPAGKVKSATTYWSTGGSPQLVSRDRTATSVLLRLAGDDKQRSDAYKAIKDDLRAPGLGTQVTGAIPTGYTVNHRVSADLGRADVISFPVLLVLLVVILGGLAAAGLPLLIGAMAILGSFTALRALTYGTDVSIYAVEITLFMGLGLAIDYGLFMVSRFREELDRAGDVETAVARTMATAGRTVAVSGITVAISLAGLVLFPMLFLRSMGFGGVATVIVDMLAALTVMPALLSVLGPRVNALPVGRRNRRRARDAKIRRILAGNSAAMAAQAGSAPAVDGRGPGSVTGGPDGHAVGVGRGPGRPGAEGVGGEGRPGGVGPDDRAAGAGGEGAWARLAYAVMRRPVVCVLATGALLLALGSPFLHITWGGVDAKVLPTGTEARVAAETLDRDFPRNATDPMQVVLTGAPLTRGDLGAYANRLRQVPGVTGADVTGLRGSTAEVSVRYTGTALSTQARRTLSGLERVTPPAGTRAYVGGPTSELADQLDALNRTLPWLALVVGLATFILLFLAFGSVVLPVKAIVMNILSLSAMFGVIVWIFQDGHLSGLLNFTATGTIAPAMPILMLAMVFGLSMDYEVFLLSRVREQYDRTGDTRTAIAQGLQRTGRLITSAALLLIVVVGAFSTSGISFIKMTGVGMVVAIAVDATVVRTILVPATMRLLGAANWWAPGPLRGLYGRFGIREEEDGERHEPRAQGGPRPSASLTYES
jgi:RND superfamily putative drug exporter